MAIDRGLNDTVSTNPLGIDDDDYQATTRGPQGVKGDDGDITAAYVDMYDSVVSDEAAAATSATNAAASAVTAADKATIATTNAINAALSEDAADLSETNSATSETNAATSATAAATSQSNSASSAAASATSETNAANSASSASTSASTATTKAATATTQASASAVSATAAQSSEDDAATSETASATSATASATSATASASSASAAATSATSSASSATSATASAATATTKAASATTSEANALTYKNAAVTAQTAAETAETNAETAETNAETAETNSATTATASATSATASATSATASASSASSSATSATAAATSATNAASSLTSFQGQYVSQSTAPSSPSTGDLWFDTSSSTMKVYSGSGWTNAGSSVNGVENSVEYIATSGQTTFSATYDAGYLQVFLNGIRLDAADYTATNGSSVVLDTGATTGDTVFIHSFGTFALADHYNKTTTDTLLAAKVDDGQVLTNVPSGALFTDTVYTLPSGIATESYVGTEISNLVDSSPAALNTLNELAAALGDDVNHVTTMTNLISAKMDKDGATMTGNLSLGDNLKAKFGNGDDLQIYHDGATSNIVDTGTGNLSIRGSNSVSISDLAGYKFINCVDEGNGGYVLLNHQNNAEKLRTTSTGIDVTGTVNAEDINVSKSDDARLVLTDTGDSSTFMIRSDGVNTSIGTDTAHPVRIMTNNAERMRIDSSGNVGIGTASPDARLDIEHASLGQAANLGEMRSKAGFILNSDTDFGSNALTMGESAGTAGSYFIAVTNSAGSGSYPLNLQPYGGNVGIGTNSPTYALHVKSPATTTVLIDSAGAGYDSQLRFEEDGVFKGAAGFDTSLGVVYLNRHGNGTQGLVIDSSGNMGLGVVPESDWHTSYNTIQLGHSSAVFANTNADETFIASNAKYSTANAWEYITSGSAALTDQQNGIHKFRVAPSGTADAAISWTTAMTIENSGGLLVGRPNSSWSDTQGLALNQGNSGESYVVNNGVCMYFNRGNTEGKTIRFYKSYGTEVGSISTFGASTAYTTSSDYRLKTDVQPMIGATARVKALKPCNFEWISSGARVDGFIAHEAQEVVPESVVGTKDAMEDEEYEVTPAIEATFDAEGAELTAAVDAVMDTRSVPDMQGIDQSKIVPLLTAALQEAIAQIESLETRLTAMENK